MVACLAAARVSLFDIPRFWWFQRETKRTTTSFVGSPKKAHPHATCVCVCLEMGHPKVVVAFFGFPSIQAPKMVQRQTQMNIATPPRLGGLEAPKVQGFSPIGLSVRDV